MGIDVRLHSSSKKYNSTKVFDNDVDYYARYDCQITAACSILNPVIAINNDDIPVAFRYNGNDAEGSPFDIEHVGLWKYAYLGQFRRWYQIIDITYSGGMWVVSLTVDALMSYRGNIGSSRQLVARCSKLSTPWLDDSYMPIVGRSTIRDVPCPNINAGCFNASIVGSNQMYYVVLVNTANLITSRGMLTPYVLDYSGMVQLNRYLMDAPQTYMGPITDVTDNMLKALINPLQYIVAVKAYPFKPAIIGGTAGTDVKVRVGFWQTDVVALGFLANQKSVWEDFVDIPSHPDYSDSRKYLNNAPYTTIRLDFLPFYQGEIDGTYLQNNRKLWVRIVCDTYTGDATMFLYAQPELSKWTLIYSYNANLALDIPVSQIISNNFAADIATTIADVSVKNASLASSSAHSAFNAAKSASDYRGNVQDYLSAGGDWRYAASNANMSLLGLINTPTLATLQKMSVEQASQQAWLKYQSAGYAMEAAENTEIATNAQNIYSPIAARMPVPAVRGNVSTLVNLSRDHTIYVEFWTQNDVDANLHGRPYYQYNNIDNCGGYCEVINPIVDFGNAAEKTMIERFMSNGFYYE